MVDLGMPTLIELPDIEDCARLCGELGLQFVEINMCLPQFQAERLDADRLKRLSDKYGVYFTIHLDDTNTPCDFNPKIAKAYTDTVLEVIALAKPLGIPLLNMHLSQGTYFTLPDRKVYLFEAYEDAYRDRLVNFRHLCQDAIGGADIKICVENTRAFTHRIGEESLRLLLGSPVFAVTFDTDHDAVNAFAQREIIDRHIDRLSHMHLHDALISARRDHLPPGDGELDIDSYLVLADDRRCRVVLEVKTTEGLRRSVEWIKRRKKLIG